MANNDTEIGVSIKTDASEASKDVSKLSGELVVLQRAMDGYNKYMDMFGKLTLGIKRMSEVNTKNLDTALEKTTTFLGTFNKKMQEINATGFASTVSTMESSLNGYNNQMNRLTKMSAKMPDLTKLDITSIANVDTSKITELASSFEKMRNAQIEKTSRALLQFTTAMERMGTLNFNANMTGNIQSQMNAAASTLKGFMDKLQGFNFDGFSRLATDIAKVPKAMKQMESLDISKIGTVFTTLATQIQPFIAHLKEASAEILGLANLTSAIGKFNNGMRQVKQTTKETGLEADKTHKKMNNMLTFGKLYAFYNQARHYGQSVINVLNKSVDFTEIENYFSRAMGNMRGEAMKFQETLSESFGMAIPDMMKAQATYKNMLGSLGGLSDDMTYMLSERVTKMTLDYASLYNATIDSSITKFQAALSKQVRPIRSTSGYDITQKVLESTAQMIGINDRSIQQMSEMEKRLLIILTLQSQMARSAAMGDFARTIENPANQLRVLQQQLSEVGRWISAVFYGTIAQVLPYINGFLMAIKEIVKTFALFMGYEMPDSSGSSDTIIDSMGDSMDGFGSSVDDANSALDDTAKKAEKAAKITSRLGFDEFNTVSKPSDSDSGSGSSGGAGAGSIDPRLLEALNKIDYMFGNVRMKAMDIKEAILGWMDAFGRVLNENIFEPIAISWDKYGASIVANAKKAFGDIGHIISSALDVVGEKWQPFFQAASDLFFSLLDTSSIVFSGITKFLKSVWDIGGKYLFEGVFDLGTAFLNLATKINDKFVKPLIRWFKDNIVPVIGSAVGAILGIVGKLLSGLGGIIDWISDCTPLVVILSGAFTGMFLTFKIAKVVDLANSLTGTHTILRALKTTILDGNPIFKKMFDLFSNGKTTFEKIKDVWEAGNISLQNMTLFTKAKEAADKLASFSAGIHAKAVDGLTLSQQVCAGAASALSGVLSFISTHPLVAMAIAIGTVVGAIALFSQSQEETKYELEDCSQAVQDQVKRINELSGALDGAKKSSEDRMVSSQAEIKALEGNIDILKRMGGESGYVENIASAEALVKKINDKLPDTVKLTEDGRLEWLKMPDAIHESIDALKEKARVEAYSELYTESIKQQIIAEREHGKAVQDLSDKQQRLADITSRKAELEKIFQQNSSNSTFWQTDRAKELSVELGNINKELETLPADVQLLGDAVNTSESAWEDATEAMKVNGDAMINSKDIMSSTSKALSGLTDEKRQCLNDLGTSLSNSKKQLDDYSNSTIKLDEQQVVSAETAKDTIVAQYAARAFEYGKSYDEMIQILMEQGITLSDEEKTQLEKSLVNLQSGMSQQEVEFQLSKQRTLETLKTNNEAMTSEEQSQYATLLQKLYDNGITIDATKSAQYVSMMKAMRDNNIAVNSEEETKYAGLLSKLQGSGVDISNEQNLQHIARMIATGTAGDEESKKYIETLKKGVKDGTIDPEVWQLLQDAGIVINNNKPVVPIETESKATLENKLNNALSGVQLDSIGAVLNVSTKFAKGAKDIFSKLGVDVSALGYANGGFPNIGQMFVAREAGPEFVGNLGGRTAVANNYQIEAGVARGVAQGMSASGGGGSSQPQIVENHVIVELDGEVVAKAVDKSKAKKGWNFGMK